MADLDLHPPSWRARPLDNIREAFRETRTELWTIQRYNLQTIRSQPLSEISGSLGDLGYLFSEPPSPASSHPSQAIIPPYPHSTTKTHPIGPQTTIAKPPTQHSTLLPLLIALTANNSISLPTTLLFSGLANILTGILFGIPLPVQPMKAIASIAIARSFTAAETASAGLFVAGAIGFLSLTGLVKWFTSVVPVPVVKGIQVGTGLSLVGSAGGLYPGNGGANWLVLLAAFLALLLFSTNKRVPYALIIFLLGVVAAVVWNPSHFGSGMKIWHPHAFMPSPLDIRIGMLEAGIGQLPLTTPNSVIAVAFLAEELLPDVKTPSTTALGLSVAVINLVGCWFGAMPVCHGSGGLAAQYRFGARSGASIIFLGLVKLLLGLFASDVALYVFDGFPKSLLCILLIAAGLELVKVGESLNTAGARDLGQLDKSTADREGLGDEEEDKGTGELGDEGRQRRWAVMFMTVAGILAFRNDAVGFSAGMLCHWSFLLEDYWSERRSRRGGQIRLETGQPRHESPQYENENHDC